MTRETEWTPGPWEASEFGDYSDFGGQSRVILGDDMRIAVVQVRSAEHEGDNANARLIAAAPEMAELLQEWADNQGTGGDVSYGNLDRARRARFLLLKLKGQS